MNKSGFIIITTILFNKNGDLDDDGIYNSNWSYLIKSIRSYYMIERLLNVHWNY